MSGLKDFVLMTFNDVPELNLSYKYERLGHLAIDNHRRYCDRHGYDFIDRVPVVSDRPACWSKIPAILKAFESYRWVAWADSDTLVYNDALDLRDACDERYDIVAQCPHAYLEPLGWLSQSALDSMYLNTGAFLIRNSAWSRQLLEHAWKRERYVSKGKVWNGIGEQEAIHDVLQENPSNLARIKHMTNLQSHPKHHQKDTVFLHFYGNHASHVLSDEDCNATIDRWEHQVGIGKPWPNDIARFHWSCIQNKQRDYTTDRGGPDRFFYTREDIVIPYSEQPRL